MKTLKKIKLDMWTNAIMTVLIGVLFISMVGLTTTITIPYWIRR